MNKRRLTTGSNGLLHVQDVRRVFIKTTTKNPKKKKWHPILLHSLQLPKDSSGISKC